MERLLHGMQQTIRRVRSQQTQILQISQILKPAGGLLAAFQVFAPDE